ncbi:FAD-binding oxidoreductase, partial [Pseudomonas syringae pv. actinidiae]|nr:FAD-binding oxidoreductase [Pseudomonas syringae pv. actinidiae]
RLLSSSCRAHLAETDRSCPGWSALSPRRSMPCVGLAGVQP